MVQEVGLEPTRPHGHTLLRRMCLPISPFLHIGVPYRNRTDVSCLEGRSINYYTNETLVICMRFERMTP